MAGGRDRRGAETAAAVARWDAGHCGEGREGRSARRGNCGLNDGEASTPRPSLDRALAAKYANRAALAQGVAGLGGRGFGRQSWSTSSHEWRVLAGFWPETAGPGRVPFLKPECAPP